jgi:hypothetical protein
MASPLVGVGFVNAVVFLANEETKRLIVSARGYSSVAVRLDETSWALALAPQPAAPAH